MKKNFGWAIGVLALFFVSFTPYSYSIEEVVGAMKNGNATQLAKYFDERIDISLPGKNDNYSKSQGELILKDFFNNNEVRDFQIKHKGENNGSQFCFGVLQTKNGNYRTKLYMKQKGDRQVLQEVGFQRL
ncbi:MAG: DUF4783 domain-containing protein, partial [Chitinophagaceae bacterium]|nr:DUF4783 domain-containing protein [Chitinophagaceae bacterium]